VDDVMTLIRQANAAGLRISIEDTKLVVRGPGSAGEIAEQLIARDQEVIAALDNLPAQALAEGRDLHAAWSGAVYEIAELLGWPELSFAPGRSVAESPIPWSQFTRRASTPDLQLVLAELQQRVAAMPHPRPDVAGGSL